MRRLLAAIGVVATLLATAGAVAADTVTTVVIGVGSQPSISPPHWVSDDGRYVVYNGPTGLTVGDLNGPETVVSPYYNYPTLSDDGRYVAYLANAGAQLWDRTTGLSEQVSLTDDDQPAMAAYYGVTVSGNGRYVAFLSSDPALQLAGWDYGTDGNGTFLRDRTLGTTIAINVTPGGTAISGCESPSLSDDAGVAAWPGGLLDGTDKRGIVIWGRTANSLSLIGADTGVDGCSSGDLGPMVSGNGRYVVWSGYDQPSDPNVPPTGHYVWIHDLQTGTTTQGPLGGSASVSDDGRYIAYSTEWGDAYRLDRQTGTSTQVNFDSAGNRADILGVVGISGDGSRVAFGGSEGTDGVIRLATVSSAAPPPPTQGTWSWGYNADGQLGDGTTTNRLSPVQVSGLTGVVALAGGRTSSLALKSDGTVWGWGYNGYGQLGDGTRNQHSTPVQASGLTGAVALAAGSGHSLALKSDGTVWAWGYGRSGELGDGMSTDHWSPTQVPGLTGVVALAAGWAHSLAVKSDGTVWAWGQNGNGQLGDGTTSQRLSPVRVLGLSGVIAVAAGYYHSLALKADGTVWAWGVNNAHELGDGTTTDRHSPLQIPGLTGVAAVATGGYQNLALKSDGSVWEWGNNQYLVPTRTSGLLGVVAVAVGGFHNLALEANGTVRSWGDNNAGELGDGTQISRPTPVLVPTLGQITVIGAGYNDSLAFGSGSTVGLAGDSVTATVGGGATVTTDPEADGASPSDPVETSVTTPNPGTITISEQQNAIAPRGIMLLGNLVAISAPVATAANPLLLSFRIDASQIPPGKNETNITVYRNGNAVPACTGAGATPDPCVSSRTRFSDGDVQLVVRTSHASDWTFGVAAPVADAGGPYTVTEGSSVRLDGRRSSGNRLSFLWEANPQLRDTKTAQPTYSGLDDGVIPITLVVTDSTGMTSEASAQVTVSNVAPIVSPIGATTSGSKIGIAVVYADSGRLDTHTAIATWGDGTVTAISVTEKNGAGIALGAHQYPHKGQYTITVRVRDDDGGSTDKTATVTIR